MNNKPGTGLYLILMISIFIILPAKSVCQSDTAYYELWQIDTLENIGGHPTSIIGDPQVVVTDIGKAVKFDGDGDMLLIDANPLGDAKEFTIEIIFKPDGAYPQNAEPRFVHIQDPDDPSAKRVMIELRLTAENRWYLDGFMNTDNDKLALIDASLTHPTGQWMHAAVTYQNNLFKTWVNGIEELSGNVTYASEIVAANAKTSLGARMNQVSWFSGIIKTLKVTHRVLDPGEFLSLDTSSTQLAQSNITRLTIYPNPANQSITVHTTSASSYCCVNIFNVAGEKVFREHWIPADNPSHQIDTTCFPEGIYLVEFYSNKDYQTKELIIIR
jgi:hypothetical protein